MLSAQEIRGLYAIIPTPAREGADRWDALDTVDLAETERLVDALIADGCRGLIVLGTTGECATLTSAEYQAFVGKVLETVARRVPAFIGATALGTHEVIDRLRFARDRGADGTLLGLPMWQPLTTEMAVRYYADVAAAFPDLAIMVYANMRAFRFNFPPEFWQEAVKAAPTITSAKVSSPNRLQEMISVTEGRVNFMPNDMTIQDFYAISPGTTIACWATAASMGPGPALAMMRAIEAGDKALIAQLASDIGWSNESIAELVKTPEVFASYNIQIEKIRIAEAGYCKPGPIRPPYHIIPENLHASAVQNGQRWAELCKRYSI